MNPDERQSTSNGKGTEKGKKGWVEGDVTYRVVGCAWTVLKPPRHGVRGKTGESAFYLEPEYQGFGHRSQSIHPVCSIRARASRIMRRIVRISGVEAGLILRFKHPTLEWRRVIRRKLRHHSSSFLLAFMRLHSRFHSVVPRRFRWCLGHGDVPARSGPGPRVGRRRRRCRRPRADTPI